MKIQQELSQREQQLSHRDQQLAEARAELESAKNTPRDAAPAPANRQRLNGREQAHHLLSSQLDRLESDWRWVWCSMMRLILQACIAGRPVCLQRIDMVLSLQGQPTGSHDS